MYHKIGTHWYTTKEYVAELKKGVVTETEHFKAVLSCPDIDKAEKLTVELKPSKLEFLSVHEPDGGADEQMYYALNEELDSLREEIEEEIHQLWRARFANAERMAV